MNKIQAFCTNLESRTDRRKAIQQQFRTIETVCVKYLPGVVPKHTLPKHTPFWEAQAGSTPAGHRKMRAKVAVCIAHLNALYAGIAHCLENDEQWFLRLEDDVELCNNFDERMRVEVFESGILERWNPAAITLGCQYVAKPPFKPNSMRPYDVGTVYMNQGSVGMYATLFNVEGATLLFNEIVKLLTFGDVSFRNLVQSGALHCFTLVPHLVTVKNDVSSVEGKMQTLDYIRKNYHANWEPSKAGFKPKVIFSK